MDYYTQAAGPSPVSYEPFSLGGHAPELDVKWTSIVADPSNAKRVIDIYDVEPVEGSVNRRGDSYLDLPAALIAIDKVAESGGRIWENLVRAGILDKICECVEGKRKAYDCPPHLITKPGFSDLRDRLHASYYIAMRTLVLAATRLTRPPKPDGVLLLKALRQHWHAMMKRLWNEPETTLERTRLHVDMRTLVGFLLGHVNKTDPTFRKVITNNKDDLTIAVAVRYWMSSTTALDQMILFKTLTEIAKSDIVRDGIRMYEEPVLPSILPSIAKGASRNDGHSFDHFVEKLASSLVVLKDEDAFHAISIIFHIHGTSPRVSEYPDFIRALIHSESLWLALFGLLKKIPSDSSAGLPGSKIFDQNRITFSNILDLATLTLALVVDYSPHSLEPLLRQWASLSELWDALDRLLPVYVSTPSIAATIMFLFEQLRGLSERIPSIYPALRSQLPRPRSLRALFDASFSGSEHPTPPRIITVSMVTIGPTLPRDINSIGFCGLKGWVSLERLQHACGVHRQCMRRGCTNRWTARCKACRNTQYCGAECQKRDWKEHRLICGLFMDYEDSSLDDGDLAVLTVPLRYQNNA
ncbi:uncharacterized protein STEHIDRAFT_168233 [Stereum hirsutum FP-91666 SS1]|uniref:uncharacterized protein n=1 Tax=Stereum hirsutum (strain FP-91666) TaxID=721885 RepID=UPI000440CAD6|nr:uncharacterized protein STEHIDRAFT_168233 [Stereum hirsutum FP-91666 SS1]EIM87509.1 hypothetical protein STEHIDRAFT_168233 [Stereum hirsutum FP-91666 SS1]